MKKGKKIWNRLLSLMLCLVMVTGVFAGMGMEAKAISQTTYSNLFYGWNDAEYYKNNPMRLVYNGRTYTSGETINITARVGEEFQFVVHADRISDAADEFRTLNVNDTVPYYVDGIDVIDKDYYTRTYYDDNNIKMSSQTVKMKGLKNCTISGTVTMQVGYSNLKSGDANIYKQFTSAPVYLNITFYGGEELFPKEDKVETEYKTYDTELMLKLPEKYRNTSKYEIEWMKDDKVVSSEVDVNAAVLEENGTGTYKAKVTRKPDTESTGGSGIVIKYSISPQYVNLQSETEPTMNYGQVSGEFSMKATAKGTLKIKDKEYTLNANSSVKIPVEDLLSETPNVGAHKMDYTFTPEKSKVQQLLFADEMKYHVNQGSIGNMNLMLSTQSFIYNGAEQIPTISVINDGKQLEIDKDYKVVITNSNGEEVTSPRKADTYTVKVEGTGNYKDTLTQTYSINRAELSVMNVKVKNRQYDGSTNVEVESVKLKNLASTDTIEDVVDLSNVEAKISDKNVGEYSTVKLSGLSLKDTNNYNLVFTDNQDTAVSDKVKISPKEVTIQNVTIESIKVYDGGTVATITNNGTLSDNYDGNKLCFNPGVANYTDKNVGGNKTVTFTGFELTGEESYNYTLSQPAPQTASITQKPLRMVEGSANVKNKVYDGKTNAEFSGTPALYSDDIVENDDVAIDYSSAPVFNEIGSADEEKSVTVTTNLKITGTDAANYSLQIPTVTAKITNYTAVRGTDYTVNSNDWMNEDFVITAGKGCRVSEGSADNSSWSDTLTVTCDDDKSEVGTKAFYVKREDGTISRVVNDGNAEYRIDKIDPTGEVKFAPAENAWTEFVEKITFGLFYKDAQEVVITSQDQEGLSGVASVEWFESLDKGMDLSEVEEITDWKDYDGSLIVALKDTKKFVYYVKITDNAGNVTYLSTDGAVYDITNPAITGVVNGETYYTTQVANVSDTNLKEVTLNGTSLAITDGKIGPITLEGNVDTEVTYTIVATDKAENVTTVTINMKPLADLAGEITDNNVVLEDEKELEKAEQILEEALKEENLSKLTEQEAEAIREKLSEIQGLLQNIDEVQNVIDLLESLPSAYKKDGKTVNPYVSDRMDDEEQKLYSAVKAAYSAYKNLSAHQQSLISAGLKNNLSNLRKILTDYRIIDGDGKVWIYDTNGTITFTANGPVCRFENALVDGKKVPAEEMKVTKGSTVVELEAGYLYRLGLGDHTFQMEYTDGESDVVEFSIVTMEEWNAMMKQSSGVNKTGGVATGDSANILLWGAVFAVGAAGMIVAKKRRKDEEA